MKNMEKDYLKTKVNTHNIKKRKNKMVTYLALKEVTIYVYFKDTLTPPSFNRSKTMPMSSYSERLRGLVSK